MKRSHSAASDERDAGRGGGSGDDNGHIALSSDPHGCYHGGPTRTVGCQVDAEQATASSRRLAQAHAGPGDRLPRHPGHCVQVCIMPSSTSPRCHRNIRARPQTSARVQHGRGRKLHRPSHILAAVVAADQRLLTTSSCGVLFNGSPFRRPYVLVQGLAWRKASQRAAFR